MEQGPFPSHQTPKGIPTVCPRTDYTPVRVHRISRVGWLLAVCCVLNLWSFEPSFGQVVPPGIPPRIDPSQRSGEPPPLQPDEPLRPRQPGQPILPPLTPPLEKPEGPRLPSIRVFVKKIMVVGSTVFSTEELNTVTAPYTNRVVTTEDLEELRQALTLLYVSRGYVNSGALLPDQEVKEGVILFAIIEGTLTNIEIEGTEHFYNFYFTSRLFQSAGIPLNINPLQNRLRLFLADPRIARLNAELKPGQKKGESVLRLKVQEASPYRALAEFNNFQTPTVGAERGVATAIHQNLLGLGDAFQFTYIQSEGTEPFLDLTYNLPLTSWDTEFIFRYRLANFAVIEAPFAAADIKLDTEIFSGTFRQPLYRTPTQELAFSVAVEHLQTQAFAFGVPAPFLIPGATVDGKQIITALRFIQEYLHRQPNQTFSARSRFSVGLDAFDATINSGDTPDGQFFSWLGQFQWARRLLPTRIQLISRMDFQFTNVDLFPLEEFAMGGRFTVRGYRENTLVRDNAFFFSFESRIPVITSALGVDILQFAPFVDVGRSWNTNLPNPRPVTLASVGAGLRWFIVPGSQFQVYWGQRLNHVFNPKTNLQDFGIHVQFVVDMLATAEYFFGSIEALGDTS